jgi:branched-chain amino acid transport system substrate-binding protein
MGFDIIEGLRTRLQMAGMNEVKLITENIGFGDNATLNYSKAEKLLIEDQADMIITYSGALNAEPLYPLADTLKKTFIFLDAGMQFPESISPFCFHISLQGIHACRLAGQMAGSGNRKVLMATSFYEGGYRGPWGYDRGLSESGGSVCANYVSGYKIAEFTIDPYIGLLHQSGASSVGACFSSYLAELFFRELNEHKDDALNLPFYCSPFMAEEQLLQKCDFPGGEFITVVPWARSLQNPLQEEFREVLEKNKPATLFHLLGWEGAIVAMQAAGKGAASLHGFSYDSPRGKVTIHSHTNATYAPLYMGNIRGDENGKCRLEIFETIEVTGDEHQKIMNDRPADHVSGWKNNYLCI